MNECSSDRFKTPAQLGSVVWYISFGDLLTLLVCFFFVLTPWHKLSSANKKQNSQHLIENNPSPNGDGTGFASESHQERQLLLAEIPLFGCQRSDERCEALEWGRLLGEVQGLEGQGSSVTVRLCDRTATRTETLERVGSALRMSEVGAVPIQVELFDRCSEGDLMRPVTAAVVGSVRIQ